MFKFGAIVVMALTVAACGGSDPASEIRSNQLKMYEAVKANNLAKFCSYFADRGQCVADMAMAKLFLGDGKLRDLFTEQDFKRAEKDLDDIQVSKDGTRATVTFDDGGKNTWVEADGDWRYVPEKTAATREP